MELEDRESDFGQGCLQRDGDRCVVTNTLSSEKRKKLEPANILPWSFPCYSASRKDMITSNLWTTLFQCFPEIRSVVQSDKINEIQNGLTLLSSIHRPFSDFQCAFEPITDTPHTYKFVTFEGFPAETKASLRNLPQQINFVTGSPPTPEDRLPHPVLLDCHYRLANIFHASGMTEAMGKTLRRAKKIKAGSLLEHDGTTDLASALYYAIWQTVAI
ncbi:uncharacterized protein N7483_012777 [Penicillium malachiteum]|uniref:uncharacterized protein n=1 Tax=Penicillium malachiteum TaxID=1324776 RepID=UPI0025483DF4|nr:uncharacterized protein N7483_012777 [Penicillium malachiteum]KAJ5715596.1 hypothetical protein N7483_012777 [Penicillium malachiteum]